MKSYVIGITLHIAMWAAAMYGYLSDFESEYWRLFSLSGYFSVFFLLPLLEEKQKILAVLFGVKIIFAVITVYPVNQEMLTPYFLLIVALIVGEMVYRLKSLFFCIIIAIELAAGIGVLVIKADAVLSFKLFFACYMLLLFSAATAYKIKLDGERFANSRYDALLAEYRALKRKQASEEEVARQEERILIGREIHDSVGHKLTALLMQLEMFRLNSEQNQQQVQSQILSLKKLAHESLEETRRAVKTLKHNETGGLQGIMRLIRKMESDSFLRVHFTVNHGAFSAPLTGEQSFAIYRSVQEALTNIMKHSKSREAKVLFEMPGGSVFRFEISNPYMESNDFKEGFGLTSMRERLKKINGDLDVYRISGQFVVRGWISLVDRGGIGD
ncbi:sensor histidine kinase [Paenibacillus sp. GXUN7292]|uniref:sensor histidine kinase n=1 Tax=Paenibacillus sp. GXUN7292 TaxID=3422499 RepID=UPI003D7DD6A9